MGKRNIKKYRGGIMMLVIVIVRRRTGVKIGKIKLVELSRSK